MKFVDCPGLKVMGPKTGVLFDGRSFTTSTLVSETFPALLTLPEKVRAAPGSVGLTGQFLVTEMRGVVMFEQVAEQLEFVVIVYSGNRLFANSVPLTNIVSVVGMHGSPG